VTQLDGLEIWTRPGMLIRQALEVASLVACVSRDTRARILYLTNMSPERAVSLLRVMMNSAEKGWQMIALWVISLNFSVSFRTPIVVR